LQETREVLIVDLKGTTPEDLKEIREALIVGLATAPEDLLIVDLEGITKLVNQKACDANIGDTVQYYEC